jgi:hypothetical protein
VGRPVGLGYELLVGLRIIGGDLPEEGGDRHLRDLYGLWICLFANDFHTKILTPGEV